MKTKMSYQNKKIAIIVAIVLVLIGGISIGAYFYFKGNTDAEATTEVNSTIDNETIEEQNNVSEEPNNNEISEENNTTVPSTNNETSSNAINTVNNGSNNVSNNNVSNITNVNASNNNTNNSEGSTEEELPNEEYIQTDYIETGKQILVSESLKVGWMNASLIRDNVSTKIDVVKPTLELNKTAEISSVNAEDNSVQKGSKITYKITVSNTSKDVDATNVTITDKVPVGTILDETTAISDEGKEENGKITWNVNVPASSSKTVSFTVIVTSEDGEIKNTAVVDGKETPETVNPVIESNKTYSSEDDIIRNGSIISYTITVTNKSNIDAITSVRDTVPEGTTLDKVITDGSSVNENVITWNNVTLKAKETKTFTFDVKVDNYDGENRVIKNVAVVGDKETTETETEVHYPVITSTKTTDKGSVEAGDKLTYTITLKNSGIVDGNVKVIDSAPIGTMFDKENGVTISNDENVYAEEDLNDGIDVTVPAKIGEVNGTVTVTFTVKVNEKVTGSIKNTAIVDDGTPVDEENPSVEIPVITTNKIAEVTSPDGTNRNGTAQKGDTITYTITVTNTGDAEGTAVVKDSVPTNVTIANDGDVTVNDKNGTTTHNISELNGNGITVTVPAKGKATVSFAVTVGDLTDGDTISNKATVNDEETNTTETTYQEPIISAEKKAEINGKEAETAQKGDTITYTITVTNEGSADGTAVVKDSVPTNVTIANNGDVTVNDKNGTTTHNINELNGNGITVTVPAKGKATVSFAVTVGDLTDGDTISNKATVNDEETNTTETTYQEPIISAEKKAEINGKEAETAQKGDTITYTITVTNEGSADGTAVVKDSVPTNVTIANNGDVTVKDKNGTTTHNINELNGNGITVTVPAKGKATVSFAVTVGDLTDGDTISNKATVNDEETNTTETTYQEPIISAEKKAEINGKEAETAQKGDTITYTITVTNEGSADGTAVVKDSVPTNVTIANNGDVTVNDKNGTTTHNISELNGNGITVTVPAKGEATVSFAVTVGDLTDGDIISNKATVNDEETNTTETTYQEPIISAEKKAEINGNKAETAKNGDTITYTITVTNAGSADGTALVKDSVPTNVTIANNGDVTVKDKNGTTTHDISKLNGNGITVTVPAKGEATVSFDVTVGDLTDGDTISNTATVNGKPTNPTNTTYQEPIISAEKKAEINGKEAETAQKGDTITYTITVTNEGSADGTAVVKDSVPTNVTIANNGDVTVNDKNGTTTHNINELNGNGITVTVPAKGKATVSFVVTVGDLTDGDIISNKATVNDDETNTTETTYQEPIISAEKKAEINGKEAETAQKGDTITYTITVTNEGSADGTALVKDSVPTNVTIANNGDVTVNDKNGTTTHNISELNGNGITVTVPAKGKATVSFAVTVGDLTDGDIISNTATVNDEETNTTETTFKTPDITISKTASKTVNAGENIEYKIVISNNESTPETVTISDQLVDTTYVDTSASIAPKSTENNKLIWNVIVPENNSLTITFEAKTKRDSFGKTINNTAKIEEYNKESTASTKVNEINVEYTEFKEGQKGSDLNIIFILDNSSSMNYPISGSSYKNSNAQYVAPSDESKTRLYNAKEAVKQFIENQSGKNTDMKVITFNQNNTGTSYSQATLVKDSDVKTKTVTHEGWFGNTWTETINYVVVDGKEYTVNSKVNASDGNKYYYINKPIEYGAKLIGTNETSNEELISLVDDISISSELSGFGTYINPAFKLINNNPSQYLSDSKKNIVIVLADGKFNGSYSTQLNTLKTKVDEIYCIGFGSGNSFDADALKTMSTNNKCYTANNSEDLLNQFNDILESTTKKKNADTENGVITFEQASDRIKLSENTPIEATYIENGETKTLFTCTNTSQLNQYGISISRDGKTITWDAKAFARNNSSVSIPTKISIKYYIPRNQ